MKVNSTKGISSERELIRLGHTLGTVVMLGSILLTGRFRRKQHSNLVMEELLRSQRQIDYLVSLLVKHEVEIDEFDMIALHNL